MNVSENLNRKIINFSDLNKLSEKLRKQNLKIGLSHGVFDLLHPGHLRHLSKAKSLVDVLVVSITSDSKISKGPGRPAFNQFLRAEALSSLEFVDYVVIIEDETSIPILETLKPNLYFKGSDYSDAKKDITGNIKLEIHHLKKFKGKIIYTKEIEFSSSHLINRHIGLYDKNLNNYFTNLRKKYNYGQIVKYFNEISKLKVLVIGETIVDEYTYAETLGKSSKDPILCINTKFKNQYPGGVLSIALHCAGLGAKTTVLTGINSKDLKIPVLDALLKKMVKFEYVDIAPKPTIIKNRIVDERTGNKVIELYSMDDSPLNIDQNKNFRKKLRSLANKHDLIIIADYGHGLFDEETIALIDNLTNKKCINVQSNAGNRGFNNISKYGNADLICLNGNEVKLDSGRKHVDIETLLIKLKKKMQSKMVITTQGSLGIDIMIKKNTSINSPALAPFIKDRVGAGDTVLAISSLLFYVKCPVDLIGLAGNLAGSWAVSFEGNKNHLSKSLILKPLKSIFI